ncbi:glycine betaine ABC transporter substrate-binding protein [Nocardioides salsibiostraticola]
MRKSMKLTALASAAVLTLSLTACGSDGGSGGDVGGSTDALDGVSIAVGSKDFTENKILGEMWAQALESKGADVDNKINLGGTEVNRDALLSGDINTYPEYNGTGWVVHLKQEEPSQDPEELTTVTAEKDLADNSIKWIGRSEFNDTYGFAASPDLGESEGGFDLQGMADYLKANPDAKVCMETEFPDRPDGLTLFEKATGYVIPQSQQQILETGLIYTQTGEGACDFGEVFTTDGRITGLGLSLVEDPGVFILYNVSFTMQNDVYEANSEVYDELAATILDDLDNDKMAALNEDRDINGVSDADVAQGYLEEVGIL